MPSLKKFSLFESEISIHNFNAIPYSISADDIILEIDCENRRYVISANIEFMINSRKCYYSNIQTNDLISFNNEFIIFSEESNYAGPLLFLGKVRKAEEKILIFKLPRKTSKRACNDIRKTIESCSEKNVYIECSSTQYMDSESISSIIELIRKMKEEKRALFFYNPGEKFKTYLKLANIMKMVTVKKDRDADIDLFIESKYFSDYKQSQNRYIVTNNISNYIVGPDEVISIGRLNNVCDICVSDERVSRVHALIINTNNSLYVIDCLSTNFTYINGWKITPHCLNQLKVNDIVVFGKNVNFKIKQI